MLQETMGLANSLAMWLCCAPLVLLVFFQAYKFWRLGMKYKTEFAVTNDDISKSMRAGIITTMGPALSIFVVGLGLITSIGAPLTLSRLSVIGNSMYESFSAQFAASAMGTSLGAEDFSMQAFTACVFVMNLGGIAMLGLPLIFVRPVSMATTRAAKSGGGIYGRVLGISAALASFGYTALNYMGGSKYTLFAGFSPKHIVSVLLGAGAMAFFSLFAKKKQIAWMREWALAFSILIGALATMFIPTPPAA